MFLPVICNSKFAVCIAVTSLLVSVEYLWERDCQKWLQGERANLTYLQYPFILYSKASSKLKIVLKQVTLPTCVLINLYLDDRLFVVSVCSFFSGKVKQLLKTTASPSCMFWRYEGLFLMQLLLVCQCIKSSFLLHYA